MEDGCGVRDRVRARFRVRVRVKVNGFQDGVKVSFRKRFSEACFGAS